MKKLLFTIALTIVSLAGNAQSSKRGDLNNDGVVTIADILELVKIVTSGETPKAYLSCPDDHHPHMIDLGLPSGTKWACCNVGANKPEDYGGYYSWGETEEKDFYDVYSYKYYGKGYVDGDLRQIFATPIGNYIGTWNEGDYYDIAGTQYDVAHVKWGSSWVMPNLDQIKELAYDRNCTEGWNHGFLLTGKNGGSIIIPAGGLHMGDSGWYDNKFYFGEGYSAYLRLSIAPINWLNQRTIKLVLQGYDGVDGGFLHFGLNVRPVCVSN